MRVIALAFLTTPVRLLFGVLLTTSSAYCLATYQPIPDNSPFVAVIPFRAVFSAFLVVGVILLGVTLRKARAEIKTLDELRRLSKGEKWNRVPR